MTDSDNNNILFIMKFITLRLNNIGLKYKDLKYQEVLASYSLL